MSRAIVNLVTRAPLGATRERVRELCSLVPELARLDIDQLELALDLIPICVLGWRTPEQAHAIVRELPDLDILVLDVHGLHRLQLDCPIRADALLEVAFGPAFHPCAVIQVTASPGGVDLHVCTAREQPDSFPLAMRMRHGLDLEQLPDVEVVCGSGSLDARVSRPLLDAIAALRAHPDPEPAPGEGRDGMDVELRVPDERGKTLVIARWSPKPDEAPRVCATLLALLDACALVWLAPELRDFIAALRRYL
jgi:hypothetical protein